MLIRGSRKVVRPVWYNHTLQGGRDLGKQETEQNSKAFRPNGVKALAAQETRPYGWGKAPVKRRGGGVTSKKIKGPKKRIIRRAIRRERDPGTEGNALGGGHKIGVKEKGGCPAPLGETGCEALDRRLGTRGNAAVQAQVSPRSRAAGKVGVRGVWDSMGNNPSSNFKKSSREKR